MIPSHQLCTKAGQVHSAGFLDNGDQDPLGAPTVFQHGLRKAPVPHPRHLQLDHPHQGVPVSFVIAIEVPAALGSPFMALCAQMQADLQFEPSQA